MTDIQSIDNPFLNKLTGIIEDNISNEQFGVSELAAEIGMSRSNLLRKIKKLTNLSASQFIRQVRLQHAMELLKEGTNTVSEISFKVGFSSTSYFIKCFGDYYGYPPGEVGKRDIAENKSEQKDEFSPSHQLAAIMFTDIEGYTALMQKDEKKAIDYRNRHREVFKTITEKFKGKILQYYGDGTLSTFNSAIDAVKCGIELQLAFLSEPQIPVRIGIHSGDILFTEDDIIGDGVNIASRIESLSSVGSVFISDKVSDEVKNQSGIQTVSMGQYELKNVGKPMEVFAISNPGLTIPKKDHVKLKAKSHLPKGHKKLGTRNKRLGIKWSILIVVAILVGYLAYTFIISEITKKLIPVDQTMTKKSIAVLPFINDSNDSTNVYIVNGLMESILNNLQKIEDLRVISRTSVEKYRNNPKSITEIGKELNVKYFIEGSGQKLGDQILLNIQLIEASSDRHLWSEQYNRQTKDIFKLQMDVAKNIADKIEVIITPEEEERIKKAPTDNLVAYDYFLKGLDLLHKGDHESLKKAIPWFYKAIEEDNAFANAYADIAIAYYMLDAPHAEKRYSDSINSYADKAMLFDEKLPQSLIAKAFFYMNTGEKELAVPYLEKALEYNPNSALVLTILSDFYTSYIPNTEKYLEYALKGIKLDIAAYDSATASFIYLHISNAFIQSGFVNEAEININKSLEYNPANLYSEYVKAYILYSQHNNLDQLKDDLCHCLKKDTTRLDILQEVGKAYYYLRDYENSYRYYKKFIDVKKAYKLQMYSSENAKIGLVYSKMGLAEESQELFKEHMDYADSDQSIYKYLSLAMYYSFENDPNKAIEHLKLFSDQENYFYWTILFLEMDPLIDNIKDLPEFKKVMKDIESKFWDSHYQMKATLKEKGLI